MGNESKGGTLSRTSVMIAQQCVSCKPIYSFLSIAHFRLNAYLCTLKKDVRNANYELKSFLQVYCFHEEKNHIRIFEFDLCKLNASFSVPQFFRHDCFA